MNPAPSGTGGAALSTPAQIMSRLEDLDRDLANRQNVLESAARAHYLAKRDKEKARAQVFLTAEGTVAERSAHADLATSTDGAAAEAEWEALRAVVRVIETRVGIGQALLKAHGRAGA